MENFIDHYLFSLQDVGYPEFLNIRPYMSQTNGDPVMYALYAVLVHSGYSCHAGHYYCYVKVSISTQVCCMHEATNYWLAVGSGSPLAGNYLVDQN